MERVQAAIKQAQGDPGQAAALATSGALQMKDLETLLSQDKLKNIVQRPGTTPGVGISNDDIKREMARIAAEKKKAAGK
jgi:hypothetical protein